MMRPAPAIRAPATAASPTPPQPRMATVSPGWTFAVWMIEPMPVVTAQPIRAARSNGMSRRIATQACSWISICSANDDRLRYWFSAAPPWVSRCGWSSPRCISVLAHSDRCPGQALVAVAAERRQAGDDMVADLDRADLAADLLDDARRFVAEHGGQRERIAAVGEVHVAMADPGGDGADQHLVRPGLADLDVLDRQRLADFAQYRGFHFNNSPVAGRIRRAGGGLR